jgi:antitoxin component YwqK of YwqJK toxin-antitoxin module
MSNSSVLHIAEVPYPTGTIQQRYSRYPSADGKTWIRHGLFVSYHENGNVASEVTYEHGSEQGSCNDFYENGQLAASGQYENGKEHGTWRFWNVSGQEEASVTYVHGVEISP